jgi:hypothetical protein
MPPMFQYCGKRFRVYKRAHKTCDTVNDYKGRKMKDAVHLEGVRCDGEGYGPCQAACLIFWKAAWLKPVSLAGNEKAAEGTSAPRESAPTSFSDGCTEADVQAGSLAPGSDHDSAPTYVCQATLLPAATEPLPWWDIRQYLEDYSSGNVGLGRMACGFIYMGYRNLINTGIGLGRPLRWCYDAFQKVWGGVPYPRRQGLLPVGTKTPGESLDLQEGEWVRVKSYQEILATLDPNNRNRGLFFDAEMVPYCGGTYRVLKRVTRIVNERTGKVQEFKNPCLILEGVFCQARYSECRLFCPRSIYSYWREIWLERVPEGDLGAPVQRPQRGQMKASQIP